MTAINKSDDLERLIGLYLRLNGYFSDGFIVHSEKKGDVKTEIDLLGIRFPHHMEKEREVSVSDVLSPPDDRIDVVICEVKSGKNQPNFNEAITKDAYRLPVILRRVGVFPDKEIPDISMKLYHQFLKFKAGEVQNVTLPVDTDVQIRGLLFAPEIPNSKADQIEFIAGDEIMGFIYRCLCPIKQRPSCSTKYDLGLWGVLYNDIVTYFKRRKGKGPGLASELCNTLREQRRITSP